MPKDSFPPANPELPDPLIWSFDFVLASFFEVDTDSAAGVLPYGLSPLEVAPGVSLVNLTAVNFLPGGNGELPEFQELTFNVLVSPDLTRGVPRFAVYVVSLASTSEDHLKHSSEAYKLPSFGKLSLADIQKDDMSVSYGDSRGEILTMTNCGTELSFQDAEQYFQVFSSEGDTVYVADVKVKGILNEHQESGKAGALHRHPFFREVDMSGAESQVYLQMVNKPGETGDQIYYPPEKFA